jgi:hypothetical protein
MDSKDSMFSNKRSLAIQPSQGYGTKARLIDHRPPNNQKFGT